MGLRFMVGMGTMGGGGRGGEEWRRDNLLLLAERKDRSVYTRS